eukprot:SAG11_NODE_3251_length_2580_cov_3.804111_5_plen_122_part_00
MVGAVECPSASALRLSLVVHHPAEPSPDLNSPPPPLARPPVRPPCAVASPQPKGADAAAHPAVSELDREAPLRGGGQARGPRARRTTRVGDVSAGPRRCSPQTQRINPRMYVECGKLIVIL